MSNLRISFILPCYNVSKYISACLDSIYANALNESEYEVICVDDCSTDSTAALIEQYGQDHKNLRLIRHAINKASGGGRNTGLRAAKGNYIWYVDPDDMICSEKVAQFVEKCETNNLDVLCFNYQDIDEQQNVIGVPKVFGDINPQNGLDFVRKVFGDSIVYHIGYIWRFIYRREFLLQTNMFFPENVVWQDTVYMPRPLFLAQRVQSVSETGYKYWHHDSSVCGSFDRQYTGRKIYIWSFSAGVNVLNFSRELEQIDMHYAKLFHDFARNYYINKFPHFLWKTSNKERSSFYKIMGEHKDVYTSVQNEQSLLTRLHLLPIAGPMVADLFALLYSVKAFLGMKN